MNRLAVVFFLTLLFVARDGPAFALECPKMPEQINKDWEVEVNAAIAKIGPVKGGELITKTNNATKDLLGKLPNAGRVYLEQMMYSAYCSALRDDKTIKESEKAKLLKEYNREVRKTLTTSPPSVPKPETKPSKNQTKGDTKSEAKLESTTPKDSLKSVESAPVDNEKNRKTLLDFFNTDFSNLFRTHSDYTLRIQNKDKEDELITIRRALAAKVWRKE